MLQQELNCFTFEPVVHNVAHYVQTNQKSSQIHTLQVSRPATVLELDQVQSDGI